MKCVIFVKIARSLLIGADRNKDWLFVEPVSFWWVCLCYLWAVGSEALSIWLWRCGPWQVLHQYRLSNPVVVRHPEFTAAKFLGPSSAFVWLHISLHLFVWFACFLSLRIMSQPGSFVVNKQFIFKKENWKIQISKSLKLKPLLTFVVWSLPIMHTWRGVRLQFPNK